MAMMGWMRRSSRYFLAVVVLTFIASLAYFGATQDKTNPASIATVNGEDISAAEYERAYRQTVEQYRQLFKERFSEDLLRSFRIQDQVVDRLVNERLMQQRAAAEGIGVSDEELADEIVKIPAFHGEDGRFSRAQYQRVLTRAGYTPAGFEQETRRGLLQRKLQGLITDGVKVSEAEARQYWETRRSKVRVAYLLVSPDGFMPGPEPADAAIETYYKEHPAEFTRPERRRVLVATLPSASVPPPAVTDAEVEAAYQERLREFEQPERRKVAHILVRVPTVGGSAAEEGARAKAEAALAKVKGGADFGQVAKEVSEDTATASRGGELGMVARGEMVPPFEQLAFDLKAGEIGGPVRTGFGYHVVKVLEVVPGSKKELREVAPTLRATLTAEGQLRALRQKGDEVQQALLAAPDFAGEARRRGLTVREIGPLARTDAIEGIGRVAEATTAVFGLTPAGVSAPVKVPEGYAIFRLVEKEDPKLLPLAELRPQVVQAVRRQAAQKAAETKAQQVVDALKAGEDPRALARREGLSAVETPAFSRTEPLPDQEAAQAIGSVALDLPEGGVAGPATGIKGLYAVKALGRELPDPAQFEAARKETERQLLDQKKNQAWQAWLASLRNGARIEVNRKVLPQQAAPQG
jgi:peptidyl-prolyl cis-trans isomerase D